MRSDGTPLDFQLFLVLSSELSDLFSTNQLPPEKVTLSPAPTPVETDYPSLDPILYSRDSTSSFPLGGHFSGPLHEPDRLPFPRVGPSLRVHFSGIRNFLL